MVRRCGIGIAGRFGERSRDPDSVALVVLNEALPKVQLLEGVGNSRSIWFEISGLSAREDQVRLLGLAAYAFPPNRLVAERKEFWEQRLVELHKLLSNQRWKNFKSPNKNSIWFPRL